MLANSPLRRFSSCQPSGAVKDELLFLDDELVEINLGGLQVDDAAIESGFFPLHGQPDSIKTGQFFRKNSSLGAQFRHDGAKHHGTPERCQHVMGVNHNGRRGILLQPLQAGEKFGENLLLFGQISAQDDFFLAEFQDAFFGGGYCRFLGLDGPGNGDELVGNFFLVTDGGCNLASYFFNACRRRADFLLNGTKFIFLGQRSLGDGRAQTGTARRRPRRLCLLVFAK